MELKCCQNDVMAFSLRLPPDLDNQARIRAEQLGVPLNAVICFALDLYLRGGMPLKAMIGKGLAAKLVEKPSKAVLKAHAVPSLTLPPALPGLGASKAERRAYTDHLRKNNKLNK